MAEISQTTQDIDQTGQTDLKQEEIVGLDEDETPKMVKLVSKEGGRFEVNQDWITRHNGENGLITTALREDPECTEVKLNEVSSQTLENIIRVVNMCGDAVPPTIEKPAKSKNILELVDNKEYGQFLEDLKDEKRKQELFDMILAANYLAMESLLHNSCCAVATMIKGQPLEKIKDILGTAGEGGDVKMETDP